MGMEYKGLDANTELSLLVVTPKGKDTIYTFTVQDEFIDMSRPLTVNDLKCAVAPSLSLNNLSDRNSALVLIKKTFFEYFKIRLALTIIDKEG